MTTENNRENKVKKVMVILMQMLVIAMVVIFVSKTQYTNGRIGLCRELGGEITQPHDECVGTETIEKVIEARNMVYPQYRGDFADLESTGVEG